MTDIITAYQNVPEERRKTAAEELHERVCSDAQRAASAMLDFCRSLKTMRDTKLYAEIGCATFDEYVEQKVGLKRRQAYNYIQTYERLGSTVLQSNAQLGITKLKLLCEISAPDIPSFLEDNDLAGMTVAQIKAAIAERDSQAEQISLLTEQVQTLESRPVEVAVAEPDEETLQRFREEAESAWKEERRRAEQETAKLKTQLAAVKEKLEREKAKRKKDIEKANETAKAQVESARKEAEASAKAAVQAQIEQAEEQKRQAVEEAKALEKKLASAADGDLVTANLHIEAIKEAGRKLSACIQKIAAGDAEKGQKVAKAAKLLIMRVAEELEETGI